MGTDGAGDMATNVHLRSIWGCWCLGLVRIDRLGDVLKWHPKWWAGLEESPREGRAWLVTAGP